MRNEAHPISYPEKGGNLSNRQAAAGMRALKFESAFTAVKVIKGYDPAANKWAFRFEGAFWDAVKHAHNIGFRGAGRRVAIIDSGCDLRIPRLRQSVDTVKSFVAGPADEDSLGHGTAVALLITEVAPDCRLDIYRVGQGSKPDESAIISALNAVAETHADVVNVSIAGAKPFHFPTEQLQIAIADGDVSSKRFVLEEQPCGLCVAASAASAKGKLVFAAAGNEPNTASCPARAKGVAAAGFENYVTRTISLQNGGVQSAVFGVGPSTPQTFLLDVALKEIRDVVGTSFAAPLFSGAAALGLTQGELDSYIASNAAAAFPQFYQNLIRAHAFKPTSELVKQISIWFERAQKKLPHVHSAYQSGLSPSVVPSDPASCFSCGIFADSVIINHGLWLLSTFRNIEAKSQLEAACALAPWSADAAANLGATMRELGDIQGALKLYELALKLRPGFEVYTSQLKKLNERLSRGSTA